MNIPSASRIRFPVWVGLVLLLSACASNAEQYLTDMKSPNPMVRLGAVTQARQEKEPKLVQALSQVSISDANATIRSRAVESLGVIGDKSAIPSLIRALGDDDRKVRREAVEALGKLKDPAAVRPLLAMAKTEDKPYDVVWALGQIASKEAIPILTPMLDSSDKYLAYNAMMALRRIR